MKNGKTSPTVVVLIIDDQHQIFIEIIQRLEKAMSDGKGATVLPEILTQFLESPNFHFPTEERLMQSYNYPRRETHAIEHRKAIQRIRRIAKVVQAGNNAAAIETLHGLHDWLETHIMVWDAKLGAFLNASGVT
jgi:hemerythrin-like metal-binding protein